MISTDRIIPLSDNQLVEKNGVRGLEIEGVFSPLLQPRRRYEIPDEVIFGHLPFDRWQLEMSKEFEKSIEVEMKSHGYLGLIDDIYMLIVNDPNSDTQMEIGADIIYLGPEGQSIIDPC